MSFQHILTIIYTCNTCYCKVHVQRKEDYIPGDKVLHFFAKLKRKVLPSLPCNWSTSISFISHQHNIKACFRAASFHDGTMRACSFHRVLIVGMTDNEFWKLLTDIMQLLFSFIIEIYSIPIWRNDSSEMCFVVVLFLFVFNFHYTEHYLILIPD